MPAPAQISGFRNRIRLWNQRRAIHAKVFLLTGDEHDAESFTAELPALRPVRNLYVETRRRVGGACSLAPASACTMPELHSSFLPAAVDSNPRTSEQARLMDEATTIQRSGGLGLGPSFRSFYGFVRIIARVRIEHPLVQPLIDGHRVQESLAGHVAIEIPGHIERSHDARD